MASGIVQLSVIHASSKANASICCFSSIVASIIAFAICSYGKALVDWISLLEIAGGEALVRASKLPSGYTKGFIGRKVNEAQWIIYETLLSLKVDVPCKNCTWYKIITITFWKDWWSLTPLESYTHYFLVGRIGGCRSYFLMNLQLK